MKFSPHLSNRILDTGSNTYVSLIIAIDGPSGSGKTTLGRMLARALNLIYVDTGSMYRAVALGVINASISPTDETAVTRLAESLDIDLSGDPDSLKVFLNGADVTEQIRSEEVTRMSSIVSVIPGVRRAMVALQRQIGLKGAVLNGRDIGTVVFPDASYKFFLTASVTERANRRYKEDVTKNSDVSLAATLADMTERDLRDSTRADSPLKIAADAVVIDSSGMSIDEVFNLMVATVTKETV
ncbi:MAG TPA: (d)CMP kinase [Pyrinomonadaceae bacterium]|nr:(d)CMP kinase [Pyrinomonadaceae bacterium]